MSNLSYKYILIRTILGEQKEAKEKFIHIPNSSKYIQFWLPAKMEAYVDTLRLLAQPKEGQQFKNKKQPELTEIELYGSLTTKEIKKKHSSRPVGGAEMGSQVERSRSNAVAGRLDKEETG